jgi:hypothetical protein
MKKMRLVGLMVLLTVLIVPFGFTGKANQLSRPPGSEEEGDEFSIYGNVKIRGTPSGHITVAVDKSFPMRGIQADGIPDLAFHFAPRKSKSYYQNVVLDLEGATVAFTGRRVTVLSADRYILLNLTIDKAPDANQGAYYDDASRDTSETVRASRGRALVQYKGGASEIESLWLCGARGGRCSVSDREMTIADDDIILEGSCPSGGSGSTSCSIDCGGGQGCSVGCGSGYYACCHCTNGCHCVRN